MRTPVFVMAGFLDSGKTTLAREVLKRSGKPEEWLIIVCEHGDEDYGNEYETVSIEAMEDLDSRFFEHIIERYPERKVLLEYNGTWPLTSLYQIGLPPGMVIQNVTYVLDGSTSEAYIRNMGPMLLEQMNFADCFSFTKGYPEEKVIWLLKQLNQRAAMEDTDSVEGMGRIAEGFREYRVRTLRDWISISMIITSICIMAYHYVNSF
ncbi:GTP-binding protein [Youngiibacter fragilis]|jgi:hypothetical protein|uniref:CobW/HypB/UreG nucleotide-binding domain-containing protein n=1 Tax=Youngiibacter fragilis 232.1 TaxID=994573 RepID=V7I8M7_9CLOT|nr:GTP-binding protein [Youngiibacter fragilis]ETA82565.1 hypothetical protein T472_0200585 [Youngiibacter fragilis 232.1]